MQMSEVTEIGSVSSTGRRN